MKALWITFGICAVSATVATLNSHWESGLSIMLFGSTFGFVALLDLGERRWGWGAERRKRQRLAARARPRARRTRRKRKRSWANAGGILPFEGGDGGGCGGGCGGA
ncbi:hypothetical protein [Nocardia sp. NPDC050435]|uniref:hypothetical protein n=1 Tax=Nocardia sp. NPDC050435 TaxID=3155040 RepID=UPI0033F76BE8